jgi:hypothetical protein
MKRSSSGEKLSTMSRAQPARGAGASAGGGRGRPPLAAAGAGRGEADGSSRRVGRRRGDRDGSSARREPSSAGSTASRRTRGRASELPRISR